MVKEREIRIVSIVLSEYKHTYMCYRTDGCEFGVLGL